MTRSPESPLRQLIDEMRAMQIVLAAAKEDLQDINQRLHRAITGFYGAEEELAKPPKEKP